MDLKIVLLEIKSFKSQSNIYVYTLQQNGNIFTLITLTLKNNRSRPIIVYIYTLKS